MGTLRKIVHFSLFELVLPALTDLQNPRRYFCNNWMHRIDNNALLCKIF